jgi:peptide/nickel transport system ATP-binding protein
LRESLVEIQNVKRYFEVERDFIQKFNPRARRFVKAVDDISFHIKRGEVFGLVGESGSGKTTTGKLILDVIKPTAGKILFDNTNLTELSKREIKPFRRRMQVIFQDPYASLNPRMKIGKALAQPLEIHGIGTVKERKQRVLDILEHVGLTPPETACSRYPHQLSGGQRQRVVIARALLLNPDFVVADEPIAMADVSMRVLLLDLMMKLKRELNLTYLFITHDLATAKYICDRIAIMYLGKIFEIGSLRKVFSEPLQPYTKALLAAVPIPDPEAKRKVPIPKGEIPNPINPPSGCRFHPRCPSKMDICDKEVPELKEIAPNHFAACYLYD